MAGYFRPAPPLSVCPAVSFPAVYQRPVDFPPIHCRIVRRTMYPRKKYFRHCFPTARYRKTAPLRRSSLRRMPAAVHFRLLCPPVVWTAGDFRTVDFLRNRSLPGYSRSKYLPWNRLRPVCFLQNRFHSVYFLWRCFRPVYLPQNRLLSMCFRCLSLRRTQYRRFRSPARSLLRCLRFRRCFRFPFHFRRCFRLPFHFRRCFRLPFHFRSLFRFRRTVFPKSFPLPEQ